MESDTNHMKEKRVEEFDGSSSIPSSDEPFREEESLGFDGSRVLEKKEIVGDSIDGGGNDDDDVNVNTPLKGSNEDSVDGSGVEEGSKESEFGERIDQNGSKNLTLGDGLSLTQKPECVDDGNDDNSKLVGDDDGGGEISKSRGRRRGRRSKIEALDKRISDLKVDRDEKVADILGSISQRTRNRVVKGKNEEVKDMDIEQNDSESNEDEDDHETGFSVGDFVWGKIKSYPSWPGRIYDPSKASEFAMRYKHEGRLLVAYFGDRTFAWCDPSQLKPFEENFEEMSKQSSLKNFVNAVDVAVNEYCLMLQMAKQQSQISLPLVVNAGIKEGVHVSLDGVEKFAAIDFDPKVMLDEIRSFARTISVTNMLVLGVLKSRLSVFYHTKGGYSLPVYYEPLGIEELEDKDSIQMNGLARGPDEGDWSESPGDLSVAQTGPVTPNGKSRRKRKEKSVAELLGLDTKVELEGNHVVGTKEEMESGKVASKSGKRKRKFIDDFQTDVHELNDDRTGSTAKEEGQSGKMETKLGRKKRNVNSDNQSHVVENSVTTRSSSRKKQENARATTAEKKLSSEEEDGRGEKDKRKTKRLPKDSKISISLGVENGHVAEELQERISPREKKISKYLSPPYTSPLQKQRSFGSVGGPLEFSDVAKMGERMTKAAGKLVGSPPIVKCSAETFQKSSKGLGSSSKNTHLDDRKSKVDESSKVNGLIKHVGSPDEVLCEMRSAARDPLNPRKVQSFDTVKGFLSSYRSANYKNGSDYNLYKKQKADHKKRKRNLSTSKQGSDKKPMNLVDGGTSESKTPRESATKKKERKSDSKANGELANGSISLAQLLITFPEEFTLPTKKDLTNIYSKFGKLDKEKTEVIPKSSSAKVVFLKGSDAQAAMDSMQKSSPFGSVKVSYEIQHLSDKAKKVDAQKKKKSKVSETQEGKSSDKHPPMGPENEPLAVIFIKKKLEEMNSMLAQTDGKMSEETKSNLENDVKELLKKVKMMTGSSSSTTSTS